MNVVVERPIHQALTTWLEDNGFGVVHDDGCVIRLNTGENVTTSMVSTILRGHGKLRGAIPGANGIRPIPGRTFGIGVANAKPIVTTTFRTRRFIGTKVKVVDITHPEFLCVIWLEHQLLGAHINKCWCMEIVGNDHVDECKALCARLVEHFTLPIRCIIQEIQSRNVHYMEELSW